MKYFVLLALGLLLLPGPMAGAQEEKGEAAAEKAAAADETPFQILEKEFAAVLKDFMDQRNALFQEYQAAADDEARQAVIAKLAPIEAESEAKKEEIAKKVRELILAIDLNDESLEMTGWILKNVQSPEMQTWAVDRIVTHFVTSEKILQLIPAFGNSMPSESNRLALEKIAAGGANDEIRGTATIMIAEMVSQARDMGKMYLGAGEGNLDGMPGPMMELVRSSIAITDEQIEEMYKNAADKFGEISFRNGTIASFVVKKLKSLEIQKNLQVGKIAPDIEGPDIDGVNFKLSDYRGKVVMLDFWGDW